MNETNKINEAGPNGNVSWMGTDGRGKRWEDYDTIKCPDGQVIDMNKLLDEQQTAKAALVHIIPFFGGFINRLRMIYTFRVKTQATDGYNLFVHPQFTYNLDLTGTLADLREYNEILFSAHSCAIEGNSFSVNDTRDKLI